ncbi:BCCT family transporter [Planococcus sp. ISL-109]|nr:BCCT family transporter [Planococcus sp. ISL-109]
MRSYNSIDYSAILITSFCLGGTHLKNVTIVFWISITIFLALVAWGLIQCAVAAIVIYSGGTQGLQNSLIIAALPFSVLVLLMEVT